MHRAPVGLRPPVSRGAPLAGQTDDALGALIEPELVGPVTKLGDSRRQEIVHTLNLMLGEADGAHVTTAALARRLQISEPALYRHFAGKTAILEALLEQLVSRVAQIITTMGQQAWPGRQQIHYLLEALILVTVRQPGLARLLIGDALGSQDRHLQARIGRLMQALESTLQRPCSQLEPANPFDPLEGSLRARMTLDWLVGSWIRFVRGGYQVRPTPPLPDVLRRLLS